MAEEASRTPRFFTFAAGAFTGAAFTVATLFPGYKIWYEGQIHALEHQIEELKGNVSLRLAEIERENAQLKANAAQRLVACPRWDTDPRSKTCLEIIREHATGK